MENNEDVQSDTDKNEHLDNIVHEILDSLELSKKEKEQDENENEKEESGSLSSLTTATPHTEPEQENGTTLGEGDDNKTTFIVDKDEASNSSGSPNTDEPLDSPGSPNKDEPYNSPGSDEPTNSSGPKNTDEPEVSISSESQNIDEPSNSPRQQNIDEQSNSPGPQNTDEPSNPPPPQNADEPSNSPPPQNTDEPSNAPGSQNIDEPSNSPGPQNVTNKSPEGDQPIKLESAPGKVDMPESQTSKLSEQAKLLEQVEIHETNITETIKENNSVVQKIKTDFYKSPYKTQMLSEQEDSNAEILIRTSQHKLGQKNEDERCCQVPSSEGVSTEIGDESRYSILENRILQFVIVIGKKFM